MKIQIIRNTGYDPEEIETIINLNIQKGWKLLGPVQICHKQGHGGHYVYLATMVLE